MDPTEYRLAKLAALIADAGSAAAFAQMHNRSKTTDTIKTAYLSNVFARRNPFGERAARTMARRAGLPSDYFEPPFEKIFSETFEEVFGLTSSADDTPVEPPSPDPSTMRASKDNDPLIDLAIRKLLAMSYEARVQAVAALASKDTEPERSKEPKPKQRSAPSGT